MTQSLVGSQLLSLGSWYTQDIVCTLQESLFLPVLWEFCNQLPLSSKSDSLSLCCTPRLGSLMWCLETSNNVRTSFVLLRSSLWAPNLAGMEFDFPVIMPLLQSHCSFSFVLGLGISFLVASSVLLLVVQQLVLILVFSQEKMSTHLSNLPPFLNLHSKVFMTILYLSGYNHQYTVHDNILTLL